jgi:fumarate hydratase, class II
MIANAAEQFGERFVAKLEANAEYCEQQVERSMALATALNPHIGYDKASDAAKTALKEDKTVREVVLEKGYLEEGEVDEVLDPAKMTERGILGRE